MHPRVFLDTFWRNDLKAEVFVAMSFDAKYEPRWEHVFKPAIEGAPFKGGITLKAVRVDIRRSGDSILSEIEDGIAHAQLILADISVTDRWEEAGKPLWARNGNVMYEVGMALTCRQPPEVIIVRDDDERLLFDVSHIPVQKINPADVDGTIRALRAALADRLEERELMKDLRVAATLEALSQFEINLIRANAHLAALIWPGTSLPAAVALALPTLLQKRVLRLASARTAGEGGAIYVWTTFGRVIADQLSASTASA